MGLGLHDHDDEVGAEGHGGRRRKQVVSHSMLEQTRRTARWGLGTAGQTGRQADRHGRSCVLNMSLTASLLESAIKSPITCGLGLRLGLGLDLHFAVFTEYIHAASFSMWCESRVRVRVSHEVTYHLRSCCVKVCTLSHLILTLSHNRQPYLS